MKYLMQRSFLFLMIISVFTVFTSFGANGPVYFTSDPSLSPDGSTIVFAYENDLWTIPTGGGTATRLTAMAGRERSPRFSPDGKWIAFSSNQDGNFNIYIIPTSGGEIKQLTYYEGVSTPESWSWDSRYIYFTSDANNLMSSYKIAISGGTPQRLFPHYFNWPHSFVENPKNGEWYFTDSWESSRFANRKRYKGEFNPDIKSWDPKTRTYKVHTHYIGKDLWPTIDKDGHVYYASDQENDEYNLYKLEGDEDQPVALTHFKTSIRQPQVDAKGDKIVFEKDYRLFLYDVASGKADPVSIDLPANNTLQLAENFNLKGKITAFDLSADDKKLAMVSRGELFVSDAEGKYFKQLRTDQTGRVEEVKWMADNITLVYTKTVDGWPNIFKIKADGSGKEEQLTSDKQSNRNLTLNKKRTFGVYLSGRNELRKIDLASGKSEMLVKDEFWGIENALPQISPDNQYVAFTLRRNFEEDIFLYHFADKNILNLTNTGVSESEPAWSPDGKYLYFTTNRMRPAYPYGFQESKIYRIALADYEQDFKDDRVYKLFLKDEKADSLNASPYPIKINNIDLRWEQITKSGGTHGSAYITLKKDETRVCYLSTTDNDGNAGLVRWSKKTFDNPETKKIEGADFQDISFAEGKSKIMVLGGGSLFELDADAAKLKKIETSYNFSKNLSLEFNQMFYETWADLDENYYDDKFHGIDWDKIKKQYESYLPYLRTRANLRVLLNDMLGELNSSHTGFSTTGDEEKVFYTSKTAATGIIFEDNAPFVVKELVLNSPATKNNKDIKAGDVLVAVDGNKIDESINRDFYFNYPVLPESIELTFKRGAEIHTVKIHPESPGALKTNLYDALIASNQKLVDDKSGKRIAYIQMKDMGNEALDKFMVEMANEAWNRDALILDIRNNTGGNVHDQVLELLNQRPYLQWKYRDGKTTTQPNFFPSGKPIILLVNEQTLSDGEMTAAGFQQLKLGKMIGTETYRWIIFTSAKTMVDGSVCRMPCWGCYKMNGDDIEKTGVTPDIIVKNTLNDRMNNRDPQLERAIEEIMKALK